MLKKWNFKKFFSILLLQFIYSNLISQSFEINQIIFYKGQAKIKEKMASYHFRDNKTEKFVHYQRIIVNKGYQHEGEFYQMEIIPKEYGYQMKILSSRFNRIQFKIKILKDELFVGGGEQFSHVILNGQEVPMWVEEQGIGRGDMPITKLTKKLGISGNEFSSYAPVPFIFSNKNRGLFCESYSYQLINLKNLNEISWEIWDSTAVVHFFYAKNPKEIIQQFTSIVGRFNPLPEWAYGSWIGLQGGKSKCNSILLQLQNYEHPISALWIQDWVGKRKTLFGTRLQWDWIPNQKEYPNFKNYCDSLNQNFNIRVLGYINPFLSTKSSLAKEAIKNDFLVKNSKNKPYQLKVGGFKAYLVDLSNENAQNWLKKIVENNLIKNGLSGWMADFGEWLPHNGQIKNGNFMTFHNRYPVEWAKINREVIQNLEKNSEILFFNRSAFAYSHFYMNSLWAGDQMTSFQKHDGMPSALTAILTGGLSGFSIHHTDIGGYTNVNFWFTKKYNRTAKLFQKWTEMAAFFPIFRTHEGLIPEKNYQFYSHDSAYVHFTFWAKIHYQLKFYFQKYVEEATQTGIPVIRHLLLQYPELEASWKYHQGFMVGDDLLIYPNFNEEKMEIFLPAVTWYCANNQQFYSDGFYQFHSNKILVFIRKESPYFENLKEILKF